MSQQIGVAPALQHVAEIEAGCRKRVETAREVLDRAIKAERERPPESDGEDYEDRIRSAQRQLEDEETRHLKWLKALREFERAVPDAKRDAAEGMKRAEVEALAKMLAIYFRTGVMNLITELSSHVLTCRNEVEVHKMVEPKMTECMVGAIDSAKREGHIPMWLADKFAEVF